MTARCRRGALVAHLVITAIAGLPGCAPPEPRCVTTPNDTVECR